MRKRGTNRQKCGEYFVQAKVSLVSVLNCGVRGAGHEGVTVKIKSKIFVWKSVGKENIYIRTYLRTYIHT
jgi:hypothetical protein